MTPPTTVAYDAMDVANLPLLMPFQIRNPAESLLVKAIMNEQHASDTLVAAMKSEERLRVELQKAASSPDDKDERAKNAASSSTSTGANTKKGGSGNNANNSKKKVVKNANTIALMKTIENQIQLQQHVVATCQQNFVTASNWTCAILQGEYSKRVVLLDPESRSYADLEEAYTFLSARTSTKNDGGFIPTEENEYYHEQRIAYVRETLPVMKAVWRDGRDRNGLRDSIATFPYVYKLQCEDTLLDALREEMHQLAIVQGLRSRLDKSDPAKNKVLRHAEEVKNRKEVETSDLVRKWYRRRSVKLHPDRNGEQMRPAFEEFTDVCNVFSDIKLRQDYLHNMLDVTYFYRTANLTPAVLAAKVLECHEMWNEKNRPDKVESVTKDTAGTKEKTLKLEGGLHQQIPKGVIWQQRYSKSTKKVVVNISIHALSPIYAFYANVRSVCVELKSTDNETHTFRLKRKDIVKTIPTERDFPVLPQNLPNEIPVVETTLNPGIWEAYWFAELDLVGTDPLNPQNATWFDSVTTRHSDVRSFEIVDFNRAALLTSYEQAKSNCKIVKGELTNILNKLRRNQAESVPGRTPLSPFELSRERYGLYHQSLVRARKNSQALIDIMSKLGIKKCTVCDELSVVLSRSRQVFSELEEAVVANNKRQEKKIDAKRFKSYIACILEGDDPMAWMKNVTSAELSCEGGDVNRLYQLFIEGKGQLTLMFDSEVYKEASLREDLFSAKQCKDLAAKGDQAAAAEAKEEEEANAAEVKRKSDEAEREKVRKECELREKWSMVGQHAIIYGLTSEGGKQWNRLSVKINYYHVDKDRFEVGLQTSDKKALLKRENLYIYVPAPDKPKQPLQQQPTNTNVVEAVQQPQPSSTHKANPTSSVANDNSTTACPKSTAPTPKELTPKETVADKKEEENAPKAVPLREQKPTLSATSNSINNDSTKMTTTIYVKAAQSKLLIGKRGIKIAELVKKSGVSKIHVETSAIGPQIPVNLIGRHEARLKAIALIQEEIGVESVSKKIEKQVFSNIPATTPRSCWAPPSPTVATALSPSASALPTSSTPVQPAPTTPRSLAPPLVLSPPAPILPTSSAPVQSAPTSSVPPGLETNIPTPVQTSITSEPKNHGVPSNSERDGVANSGVQYGSMCQSESNPASHFSFDDALLPRGLIDSSISTPTKSYPQKVPSEIGIRSQETGTTIATTEDGDRSSTSNAPSCSSTLNENDPLLMFLRSQHQCIKGNIEEFYIWLVKSEDIDSMSALKEAVSDDEYLADSMKVGCGTSGLKGFKRKAFQRAVMEYNEVTNEQQAGEILSSKHNTSSPLRGSMDDNPLLPFNLFRNFGIGH